MMDFAAIFFKIYYLDQLPCVTTQDIVSIL